MIRKTRDETILELRNALSNISNIYKDDCVKWSGVTSDTREPYSEIIANELLKELKEFDNIPKVTRTNTYCRENHKKIKIHLTSNRKDNEVTFAKRLAYLNFDEIGTILDYQVPLKGKSTDEGLGKIDLISYNENNNTLYLIELKYKENKETLLRAILEIYTYYKTVDEQRLIKDCLKNTNGNSENFMKINVVPTVLLVPLSQPFIELKEMELGHRPYLKKLALALGIRFFTTEFSVNLTSL